MKTYLLARAAAIAGVTAALATAAPASAATYYVMGAFNPPDGASFRTLLGGGSFDGTFVLPGSNFPTSGTTSFTSYTINLRNRAGAMVEVLTQGSGGYVSTSYASTYGGTVLNFYELVGSSIQNYLFLVVPTGFNGNGSVLASPSIAAVGTQQSGVASARIATTPLPEPATWAMLVLGFGAVGAARRGRRQVRFAAGARA